MSSGIGLLMGRVFCVGHTGRGSRLAGLILPETGVLYILFAVVVLVLPSPWSLARSGELDIASDWRLDIASGTDSMFFSFMITMIRKQRAQNGFISNLLKDRAYRFRSQFTFLGSCVVPGMLRTSEPHVSMY